MKDTKISINPRAMWASGAIFAVASIGIAGWYQGEWDRALYGAFVALAVCLNSHLWGWRRS